MESWTAHHGLLSAVGPCSSESRAVLSRALAYLGISHGIAGEGTVESTTTFNLSLYDSATGSTTSQIEFDDKTRTWSKKRGYSDSRNTSSAPRQIFNKRHASSTDVDTDVSISCSSTSGFDEDWTALLPNSSHVDLLKSAEWSKTSLGPMSEWPFALRLMTMKMLDDPRPANIYWGPNRIAIYNEPFSAIAQSRHPSMMGATAEKAMPATYPMLAQIFDEIERTGVAFSMPEFEMSVEKTTGFLEEAWYDGIFSPIRNTDGMILGLYNSGFEVTARKLAQRNTQLVHQIAAGPTAPEISPWQHILQVCSAFDRDVPLLVLYSANEQEDISSSEFIAHYEGSLGIEPGHPALPEDLDLYQGNEGFSSLLRAVRANESAVPLDMPHGRLPTFLEGVKWRGHGDACTHIIASPLYVTGLIAGFIIMGLNPRRPYDEAHRVFVEDVRRVSNSLLEHSVSFKQARKREEKLERELTQRQKFLQRVAEIATVGIYTHSADGLLTWANSKYFEISGVTQKPEETYKYKGVEYVLEEDREKGMHGFLRCLETKSPCTLELRLMKTWRPPGSTKDEPCWIMTTITPEVKNDEVVEVLGCLTDVSHLKWAEKFQTEAAKVAQRAKQQQERFIDTTSHEMRNPLSAILQCADDIITISKNHEKLCDTEATSRFEEAFQNILEDARSILFCATHQRRIVDDILTVSKLDSSMLMITPVAVNPQTLARQAVQLFSAQMVAEGIQSSFEVQKGFSELEITSVNIDPSRLTQILMNLISNAIKFTKTTKRKQISVRIDASIEPPTLDSPTNGILWFPSNGKTARLAEESVSEPSDEAIYVMFEVEDSGAGISKDEMMRLFNRFVQATPKTHVTYGGSGLGLFISRELVELQGGTIGMSSQPGVGSTFAFYIRTTRADSADDVESQGETSPRSTDTATTETRRPGASRRQTARKRTSSGLNIVSSSKPCTNPIVLFVEDNLINQKVLSKQLERAGCKVYKANHGVEALDMIERSRHYKNNQNSDLEIDVVLMDWEMPVMDGVTCTKRIRELEADGQITKHLSIIGVTANARPEQVEIALGAGMDDLVTKPFTVTELMSRIDRLVLR